MVRRIHDFDPPDRFLAGTVGQPGARAFFLQARRGDETVSVALEKVQVAALADRLLALLAEVRRRQAPAGQTPRFDADEELVELRPGVAPGDPRAGSRAGTERETGTGPEAQAGEAAAGSEPAADLWRLEEPVEAAFRAGTLSLAWDGSRPEIVVEAQAVSEEDLEEVEPGAGLEQPTREWDDDDPAGPDLLRVHLTTAMAERFARAAQGLVAAGRPPCPLCGQPLDPQGHLCPRRNGHTPRLN